VYVIKTLPEIVMVGGGEKSSQRADIAVAQRRAAMIAEERS